MRVEDAQKTVLLQTARILKKSFENSFHLSHGQLLAIRVFFSVRKNLKRIKLPFH